ncbi:MAG: ABC transporter permease [Ruminococcaceae bacterium]|nr:ABC transporter permease [Oscillospiraceae bacterium]
MKYLFSDLWANIKKSPFLFLFLFLQIVITSLVLYSALANYYWTEERSDSAQIAWGDKEYLKMAGTTNMNIPKWELLLFSRPTRIPYNNNGDYSVENNLRIFENIERFCEEAYQIDGLKMIPFTEDNLHLKESKNWTEEDKVNSEYTLFWDHNDDGLDTVHALHVGSETFDFFNLKLSEGEFFSKEDYLFDGEYIPVIMGSDYKKYYTLGEEFPAKSGDYVDGTYKVIGFLAEDQYFSSPSRMGSIRTYNNHIVIPNIERSREELLGDYKDWVFLYTSRFMQCYYIIEPEQFDEVRAKLDALLVKYDFNDTVCTYKPRIEKELASNYKDQLAISIIVCMITLLFSLFSFVFTMLYKIDSNMKNYAIRMVVGETRNGIAMRYLFESFVIFLLGQVVGFFAFRIYAVNSYIYQGNVRLEVPTLQTGIALNILFYIVTAIILYISINVKLKTYSVATLIRGNEVKKERRMPFYRVVIFCMLAIVGVFSMFIASYQVALDRIDLYYTGYYTKNVKMASVMKLMEEDAPNVKIVFDEIGAQVPDAIINRYVSLGYRGEDYISERGIYFNGYIDPVNMLQGRFFTHEDVLSREYIAVVGKEIYEKYVTFNENNEPIYHSPDLDKDLLVIGVMGKEDQATNLDLTVLMPIRLGAIKFGAAGSYTLDGKDEATVAKLEEVFVEHVSQTAKIDTRDYNPRLTVEAPTDMLFMLLIMIIINAVVFCFYYVSKQENIHYVKKLVGYSMRMILIDTFLDFSSLTFGAFVTGNVIVLLLKETICKDIQLFEIYMIDPVVIAISLVSVLLLAVFLSVIAIAKTFASTNNNRYRN